MLIESISGVRGVYGKEITEQVVANYAYALCKVLNPSNVVVGTDTRPSGPALKQAITQGLTCSIIDVGVASTPTVQHAVRHFNANAGIIITASHNEPEYNGLKLLDSTGAVVSADTMHDIIRAVEDVKRLEKDDTPPLIHDKADEAQRAYTEFVKNQVGMPVLESIKKHMQQSAITVVLDPNGGTGVNAQSILEELGVQTRELNAVPGVFNRTIEPTQESLQTLVPNISEPGAAFGAGFDCDGDRVELVCKDGTLVSGNHLLAVLVQDFLSTTSTDSEKVVVNDATSLLVKKVAESLGASVVEVGVGETNVVSAMREHDAKIGGEGSSGGVIKSPGTCRDGLYTLLGVIGVMAKTGKSIEELVASLPTQCNVKDKISLMVSEKELMVQIKQAYPDYKITSPKDGFGGLKVWQSESSFVWFRLSKTEGSVVRIIADAPTQEQAQTLLKEAISKLSHGS